MPAPRGEGECGARQPGAVRGLAHPSRHRDQGGARRDPGQGSAKPRATRAPEEPLSPVPARHLTSAGTGRFSAAAFSSSTESVCLSVSGAVVSGLRSQRASLSRASDSAAASGSSSSVASAIAAAPGTLSSSGAMGTPKDWPGPLPGKTGFQLSTGSGAGRTERNNLNPEALPQCVGGTEVRTDVALNRYKYFRLRCRRGGRRLKRP